MTGVARWNYQRLLDLKQPDVILPPVFDPLLITGLNSASKKVTGKEKYPALHISDRDTGERFGLEYREPGCRPVQLDWSKHRVQRKEDSSVLVPLPPGTTPSKNPLLPTASQLPPAALQQMLSQGSMGPPAKIDIPPIPLDSSPRSARTGPIKTGGRVFVLDHKRWTSAMKEVNMEKKFSFFPGKISVVFRKGPRGYLRQDPSDAAKLLKDNSSLQDKSAPLKEDTVKQNALTVIRQRGGDVSDRTEVLGEYILQFGKYKGKSFRWLLENDVGYTVYLLKHREKEEAAGVCTTEGHKKASLLSFVDYARSFEEIISLLRFQSEKPTSQAASEDDQLVGFGTRAKSTWQEVWENRADGYAAFIMRAKCFSGSQMHKLQQYLIKKESASLPSPPVLASSAHDEYISLVYY
ncbi:hypothetical protein D5F01_LYC24294 [Larimichthys crocea]|uniref:Uncharacterized protein n=1 Tax=Larimichthys crocea TaxID=215358 RepID=A0A6G0HFD2_LARCR|nr:hypothetical protein D5F01_LYC24294 [Larimichthys crocea]